MDKKQLEGKIINDTYNIIIDLFGIGIAALIFSVPFWILQKMHLIRLI